MKSLLLKDLHLVVKNKDDIVLKIKILLMFLAAYLNINALGIILIYSITNSIILSINKKDEKSNYSKYIKYMPIKTSEFLIGKIILIYSISLILTIFFVLFNMTFNKEILDNILLFILLVSFLDSMIFIEEVYFNLKFGLEKIPIIYALFINILFLFYFLINLGNRRINWFKNGHSVQVDLNIYGEIFKNSLEYILIITIIFILAYGFIKSKKFLEKNKYLSN